MSNKFNIKVISNRTGLSPQLIRTWEKRYNAVEPDRSVSNRRLYSEQDLEKLILLKRATSMGIAISSVAQMSIEELYGLVDKRNIEEVVSDKNFVMEDAAEYHFKKCIEQIEKSDYSGLESALLNASSSLGQLTFIEDVIQPVMKYTGDCWFSGEVKIAQEHMVSSIVRSILGSILISGHTKGVGSTLLVTTPSRQQHELGALMSAVIALSLGWQVVYLGPDLPVEEIAQAAVKQKASTIALSLTYPANDPVLKTDLLRFKKIVGDRFKLIIGGRVADSYLDTIEEIDAVFVKDINALKEVLAGKKEKRI